MQTRSDTIVAIATAPGRGGIAVVRVSGPDAFAVAQALTGRAAAPGRIRFATFKAPDGGKLDEGVVLAFAGPHSYTGEDVVEFQCHGGVVTPRRILEACFTSGARLARRGEFTERAFLNGRLGLDQAESVLDLIEAKTVRAADAALQGLAGETARAERALYERALTLSSELEHALDVDEAELPDDFMRHVRTSVGDLRSELLQTVSRARAGKLLREGALVVLAGPPNVGKSSLMNALLKENRAIVSAVPGTTRDSIEEWLDVDGWPVRLVDTAGLRETEDTVEAEGVRRSRALMARADVVLLLESVDSPDPVPNVRGESVDVRGSATPLFVWTKCDLGSAPTEGLAVCAKTGAGLDRLRAAIARRLAERTQGGPGAGRAEVPADGDGACASRFAAACLEALAFLREPDLPEPCDGAESSAVNLVLTANRVRSAAERLGEELGATYSSDLLDRLFSRFCVGK